MEDIVAAAIENKDVLRSFWEKISPTLMKKAKLEIAKAQLLFGKHVDLSFQKNSSVRLLCSKTTPTPLKKVYVSNTFNCKHNEEGSIRDDVFISDIRDGKRIVIRGNGGSGKTFFLKHLWNQVFEDPRGQIPVFIELRKFNDFQTTDLNVLIKYTLTNAGEVDEDVYKSLLNSGSLVLILDGFDEVQKDRRKVLEKEILKLESECPACPVVVSSRANEIFHGWVNFYIYDVDGFSLEQVKELVRKATVEDPIRKSFLKVLNDDFYKKHETFLKNPLLALMMLITFRDNASIPDNLNSFYSNAFHTLFQNHDATKEAFVRQKSLGIVEFQKLFAMFCLTSYLERKFEFSETEFLLGIEEAKNFLNSNLEFGTSISASAAEIRDDIVEAVNLMQLDGLQYTFIHRSFQEYFAAYYAIHIDSEKTAEFLELFSSKVFDDVFKISYQMKPSEVVSNYIIPKYDEYEEKGFFSKLDTEQKALNYLEISDINYIIHFIDKNPKKNGSNITSGVYTENEFLNFLHSVRYTIISEDLRPYYRKIHQDYTNQINRLAAKYYEILKSNTKDGFSHFCIKFSEHGPTIAKVKNVEETSVEPGFFYEEYTNIPLEVLSREMIDDITSLSVAYSRELQTIRQKMIKVCKGLRQAKLARRSKSVKDIYMKKQDIPF